MSTQIIEFNRPNKSVPWGFSIQGGKEFGCPLSVLKVTPGSIAHRFGVAAGDGIVTINDQRTDTMTHQQAIIQIQNLKVNLEIKKSKSENEVITFPPPPVIDPNTFSTKCEISTSIGKLPPPPSEMLFVKPPTALNASPVANDSYSSSKPARDFPQPTPPKPQLPRASVPINKFDYAEYVKPKPVPQVVLDQKNLESFQQKLKEDKAKKPELSEALGKVIQNQKNQPRDSKPQLTQLANEIPNSDICFVCKSPVAGAYISANNKTYCKHHFCCHYCGKTILGNQFIETKEGTLYCIEDYERNIAPLCSRCGQSVIGEQILALGKCWHPHCFLCDHCKIPIPRGEFHVQDDKGVKKIYCQRDYKEHYEIKCSACNFPIDNDDKYVVVAGKNYHVNCYKR